MSVAGPHAMRRRRRVRWVVTGVAVLAVLGVGTAVAVTRLGSRPAAAQQGPKPAETVEVVKVDLAERQSLSGDLGFGAEQPLTGRQDGTVTALPVQGAVLDRGATVYEVNAQPVVLFFGTLPLFRDVGPGVTDGPDVRLVEENLRALGLSGFGTPDEKFTAATEAAIKRWQKARKVAETGIITMGQALVTTGPVRVSTVTARLGGEGTGEVLKYTGTTRSVAVELTSSEKDLAKPGTKVTLTINGQPIPGTVAGVVPAAGDDQQQPGMPGEDSGPKFVATISIDDMAAIGTLDAGTADVEFTTGAREGVLAVPVGALLALAEGGYAVEVVGDNGRGRARRLIPVETGLFADGLVEVSGDGLAEGMTVVTTS